MHVDVEGPRRRRSSKNRDGALELRHAEQHPAQVLLRSTHREGGVGVSIG